MIRAIDQHAVRIPRESGLLPCLYVPIAARDVDAIERYVGGIDRMLSPEGAANRAVLVEAHEPPERDERLAIWDVPEAAVLHSQMAGMGSCRLPCLPARLHARISRS